jgi:putative aldouronate transport system substrate-binding protein
MNAAIAVSADFEHPEAIIKMLNIVTEIHTIGSDMFEPFYQESNRNEAGDSFMVPIHEPSWERIQTEAIANAVINDASAELDEGSLMIYENIRLFEETGDPSAWTDWNRFYPASGHAYYVLYVLNGDATITRNLWQQLPSPSMQSNLAIWRNMADEAFVRIVAGADVSEWQDLVDAWAGLGGDEIKEAIASQQ